MSLIRKTLFTWKKQTNKNRNSHKSTKATVVEDIFKIDSSEQYSALLRYRGHTLKTLPSYKWKHSSHTIWFAHYEGWRWCRAM